MVASFRLVVVAGALGVSALFSTQVQAANGIKERIAVGWEPGECMNYVDRSANPIYEFRYTIPKEDPAPLEELLPDEVEDSRRHQFFAMCEQRDAQINQPPLWISEEDVAAALERNLINDNTVDPQTDVLDNHPGWTGCFQRINGDNDRFPIANESVADPVQWDTTDVPEGVYYLWGYTWEPAFNLWEPRRGSVVKVFDGGDPAAIGPAGAVTTGEVIVNAEDSTLIEGCADGLQGTTVQGYIASTIDAGSEGWSPPWVPFTDPIELTDGTFALELSPGSQYATQTLLVRVDVTDPQGRTYEAHMFELVNVLPGSSDCDEGGGNFLGPPGCGGDESSTGSSEGATTSDDSSQGTTTSSDSATSGDSTSAASAPGSGSGDGGSGGTCAVARRGDDTSWLALSLLGLLGLRRRR